MSLLIAIKSCQRDMENNCHQVIRSTWGSEFRNNPNVDLQFFIGLDEETIEVIPDLEPDESRIMAPDDYDSLTLKTIEIVRWARKLKYDYVYLADTDTFIIPRLLMSCGFENYDFYGMTRTLPELGKTFCYTGRTRGGLDFTIPQCYPWASGGYGYFLSQKAMDAILQAPPPTDPVLIWCEDLWVGQVMGPLFKAGQIRMANIENYQCKIAWHFPQSEFKSVYNPKFGWMEKMYKENR